MADSQPPEEEVRGINSKGKGTGPRKGSIVPFSLDLHHPPSTFISQKTNMKKKRAKPNVKLEFQGKPRSSHVSKHTLTSVGQQVGCDRTNGSNEQRNDTSRKKKSENKDTEKPDPTRTEKALDGHNGIHSGQNHLPYNVILGRTDLRSLGAVASTIHLMIKFHTDNKIATMATKKETLQECQRMEEAQGPILERRITHPRIQASGRKETTIKEKKKFKNKTMKRRKPISSDSRHPPTLTENPFGVKRQRKG
nr:reverse transcriptase domain-containing protein [Tanacetum cinerariifolium]